jgi:hypothetical protein
LVKIGINQKLGENDCPWDNEKANLKKKLIFREENLYKAQKAFFDFLKL